MVELITSEYFSYLPCDFVAYLALVFRACVELKEIVFTGVVDLRGTDYYEIIFKFTQAMILLRKRYRLVEKFNETLNLATDILQERDLKFRENNQNEMSKSKMIQLLEFDLELRNFLKPFFSKGKEELLEIPNASALLGEIITSSSDSETSPGSPRSNLESIESFVSSPGFNVFSPIDD